MRPTEDPTSKGHKEVADDNRLVAAVINAAREHVGHVRFGRDIVGETALAAAVLEYDRLRAAIEEATQGDEAAHKRLVEVATAVSPELGAYERGRHDGYHAGVRETKARLEEARRDGGGFVLRGVLSRNASDEWTEAEADEATDAILDFFKTQGWQYGGLIGISAAAVPAEVGAGPPKCAACGHHKHAHGRTICRECDEDCRFGGGPPAGLRYAREVDLTGAHWLPAPPLPVVALDVEVEEARRAIEDAFTRLVVAPDTGQGVAAVWAPIREALAAYERVVAAHRDSEGKGEA